MEAESVDKSGHAASASGAGSLPASRTKGVCAKRCEANPVNRHKQRDSRERPAQKGKTEKQRNELLGRLHFFNGKLTSRGINLSRWGCLFEVSPGQPAKDLISLSVIKTTPENTPKPETP